MSTKVKAEATAHHLLVVLSQDARQRGYRVLDVRTDYAPLTKELACRAAAEAIELADQLWTVDLRVDTGKADKPVLVARALLADDAASPPRVLTSLELPLANLAWIAADVAAQLTLTGPYQFAVTVLAEDSPVVANWGKINSTDDFEVITDTQPALMLPGGFAPDAQLGRMTRIGAAQEAWTRCVFTRSAFGQFMEGARQATTELSWLGLGRQHASGDACRVVIDQIVALPGECSEASIHTQGRDWARYYERYGERLTAYLHLHPRSALGRSLPPSPSPNDSVLAWDMDLTSPRPLVFPIALFGTCSDRPGEDVAAFAYDRGVLTRVQLEIEQ